MAFCSNCGTKLNDDEKFCHSCGKKINNDFSENSNDNNCTFIGDSANINSRPVYDDVSQNKVYAILAYLGILILIPILAAPNSKFARFHTNQGLVLLIFSIAYGIFSAIIKAVLGVLGLLLFGIIGTIISILFAILVSIIGIVFFVLMIIGIVNAAQGKFEELPIIGKIRILK